MIKKKNSLNVTHNYTYKKNIIFIWICLYWFSWISNLYKSPFPWERQHKTFCKCWFYWRKKETIWHLWILPKDTTLLIINQHASKFRKGCPRKWRLACITNQINHENVHRPLGCKHRAKREREQWKGGGKSSSPKLVSVKRWCQGFCLLHPHNKDIHKCLVENKDVRLLLRLQGAWRRCWTDWLWSLWLMVVKLEKEAEHTGCWFCLNDLLVPLLLPTTDMNQGMGAYDSGKHWHAGLWPHPGLKSCRHPQMKN